MGPFQIDNSVNAVICQECDGELTPMYFIEMIHNSNLLINNRHKEMLEYEKVIDNKSRVKCRSCGIFTKIK